MGLDGPGSLLRSTFPCLQCKRKVLVLFRVFYVFFFFLFSLAILVLSEKRISLLWKMNLNRKCTSFGTENEASEQFNSQKC